MKIITKKESIFNIQTDIICVGMSEKEDVKSAFWTKMSKFLAVNLEEEMKIRNFEKKIGQHMFFSTKHVSAKFVMVCGMSEMKNQRSEAFREMSATIVQNAKKLGANSLAIQIKKEDADFIDVQNIGKAITEGALLADYSFTKYKEKKNLFGVDTLMIITEDANEKKKIKQGIEIGNKISEGVIFARDLVNTPAKDMTPQVFVNRAQKIEQNSNGQITLQVFDKKQCRKKDMNAFLSVTDGSHQDPAFIHIVYTPEKPKDKSLALIGKGVTFDSGGLSLKPGKYMETMKCDMAGSAAVLGVFQTLADLKPEIVVHGIIAATENMLSGRSTKPGDVVRASNGKTIEILNTDAEGRLTLADALTYAGTLNTTYIVDLATLTGACVVALGEEVNGLMANDDELAEKILSMSERAGEKVWRLPLEPSYMKLIESDIADIRNISTSQYGGTLTAGLFLSHFVPKKSKWAHIDIAGPAFAEKSINSYTQKGGTGAGVRTLIQLISSM